MHWTRRVFFFLDMQKKRGGTFDRMKPGDDPWHRGAHNTTPAPVSNLRITFPAGQKSVLIRNVKPEIKPSLLTMVTRGEACALVLSLASPCWLSVAT